MNLAQIDAMLARCERRSAEVRAQACSLSLRFMHAERRSLEASRNVMAMHERAFAAELRVFGGEA